MPKAFGITLTARLKHAALFAAAKRLGSQAELARRLGVKAQEVCSWINLRRCPRWEASQYTGCTVHNFNEAKSRHLADELLKLTGQTMEELFPAELRGATDFLAASKTIEMTKEIDTKMLMAPGQERFLLPHPEESAISHELKDAVADILRTLTYREREIIKLRYGLGDGYSYTLEEVGHIFKVTRERIRAIEAKALRKLQDPERSERLRAFSAEPENSEEECYNADDWEWFRDQEKLSKCLR